MSTPGRDTYAWRQIRAALRYATGTCARCHEPLHPGLRYPHPLSTTAGHIIAVEDAPDLADEPSNARPEHLRCNTADGAHRTNRKRTGSSTPGLLVSPDWT